MATPPPNITSFKLGSPAPTNLNELAKFIPQFNLDDLPDISTESLLAQQNDLNKLYRFNYQAEGKDVNGCPRPVGEQSKGQDKSSDGNLSILVSYTKERKNVRYIFKSTVVLYYSESNDSNKRRRLGAAIKSKPGSFVQREPPQATVVKPKQVEISDSRQFEYFEIEGRNLESPLIVNFTDSQRNSFVGHTTYPDPPGNSITVRFPMPQCPTLYSIVIFRHGIPYNTELTVHFYRSNMACLEQVPLPAELFASFPCPFQEDMDQMLMFGHTVQAAAEFRQDGFTTTKTGEQLLEYAIVSANLSTVLLVFAYNDFKDGLLPRGQFNMLCEHVCNGPFTPQSINELVGDDSIGDIATYVSEKALHIIAKRTMENNAKQFAQEQSVYRHIFMTRNIPVDSDSLDIESQSEKQGTVLDLMNQFLKANVVRESILEEDFFQCIYATVDSFRQNLNATPENLLQALKCMKDGFVIIHLLEQNTTLLIQSVASDQVRVVAFECYPSDTEAKLNAETLSAYHPNPLACTLLPKQNLDLSMMKKLVEFRDTVGLFPPSVPTTRRAGKDELESREMPIPNVVTEFLFPLMDARPDAGFPQFFKAVDTTSYYVPGTIWRRSSLWTVLKAIMQFLCEQHCGADYGKLVYKCFMLHFMTWLVNKPECSRTYTMSGSASAKEYMAKLWKRMVKLERMEPLDDTRKALITKTCMYVHAACKGIDYSSKEFAVMHCNRIKSQQTLPAPEKLFEGTDLDSACLYDFTELFEHLAKTQEEPANPPLSSEPFRDQLTMAIFRVPTLALDNILDYLISHPNGQLWLTDGMYFCEEFIRKILWPQRNLASWDDEVTFEKLFNLQVFYSTAAGALNCKNQKLLFSKAVLYQFAIVAFLDYRTCQFLGSSFKYSNHKPAIRDEDLTGMHSLLLDKECDIELLCEVEEYFTSRKSSATKGDLFSCSEDGVAESYARMFLQDNGKAIKAEAERMRVLKLAEARDKQLQINNLVSEKNTYNSQSCSCRWRTTCYRCRQISYLQNQINSVCRIDVYEWPLPADTQKANIVVFFRNIPPRMCFLQNAFTCSRLFVSVVAPESISVSSWWPHSTNGCRAVLGSTNKAMMETHFANKNLLHLSDIEDLIVPANRNLIVGTSTTGCGIDSMRSVLGTSCTIELTRFKSELQWVLDSATSAENKGYSTQAQCPPNMTLLQYLEFTRIRAGGALQFDNIIRALHEGMDFTEPHTFDLLRQALWQVGPPPPLNSHTRPWKLEVHSEEHVTFMCDLLSAQLDKVVKNWESDKLLRVVILLASYTSHALPHASEPCVVLRKCRRIACDWIQMINSATFTSVLQTGNIHDINEIRARLVSIALCVILTFDAPEIIVDHQDALNLELALLAVRDNTTSPKGGDYRTFAHKESEELVSMLFAKARRAVVAVVDQIHCLCESAPTGSHLLTDFLCVSFAHMKATWLPLKRSWKRYTGECNDYYWAEAKNCSILQIGVADGVFLVNGAPSQRLPSNIEESPLFKRTFDSYVFQVVPVPGGFKTKDAFHNALWEFKMCNNTVTILEYQRLDSGVERVLQLLPSTVFQKDLQKDLVSQYTHWYCPAEDTVEFRNLGFTSPTFLKPEFLARLEARGATLVHTSTQKRHLGMHGALFSSLMQVFQRLDMPTCIHMYDNGSTLRPSVAVHLLKLGLDFEVSAGEIRSIQFSDYIVGTDQYIGTLLPLKHMLVLTHKDSSAKLVVVPAVPLSVEGTSVIGSLQSKRLTPPYFSYDVDDVLCKLKPQLPLAAIYQSYLHAATSYHFPDPFTGMTGTESAMLCLKSFSTNIPYDATSETILDMISKLAPAREAFPEFLNFYGVVEWPRTLVPQASTDALKLQAERLLKFHQQVLFLHNKPEPEVPSKSEELAMRLGTVWYNREAHKYSPVACLDELEISKVATRTHLAPVPQPAVNAVCEVTAAGYSHTASHSNKSFVPYDFVTSQGAISGYKEIGDSIQSWKSVFYSSGKLVQPQNIFLSLYMQASERNVSETTAICALLAWIWSHEDCTIPRGFFEFIIGVALQPAAVVLPVPPRHSEFIQPSVTFDEGVIKEELTNENLDDSPQSINQKLRILLQSQIWKHTTIRGVSRRRPCAQQSPGMKHWLKGPYENWYFNALLQDFCLELENVITDVRFLRGSIPLFHPLLPTLPTWQPFTLDNKRVVDTTQQLEPRFEEIARVGKDAALEALFQKCLSGDASRSRGVISADISVKKEQYTRLGDIDDDDEANDANEEKRRQLRKEIKTLQEELKNCGTADDNVPFPFSSVANAGEFTRKMGIEILASLKASWHALCNERKPNRHIVPDARKCLQVIEEIAATQSDLLWDQLRTALGPSPHQVSWQTAQFAGIHTPVVPFLVIASLLDSEVPPHIKKLVISYTIFKLYLLKSRKCLSYLATNSKNHLLKELSQQHAEGWSVEQYPQWLVFEIEQGIFIRAIQAEIARQIIDSKESICLQLQMGEGKTSVILPIVCAVLSNGNKVARVNVIPSLLETCTSNLTMALGGMLSHTIFQFPFSRSIRTDSNNIEKILHQLEIGCMPRRGVIVTVSEHRLSFVLQWELKVKNSLTNPELSTVAKRMDSVIQFWNNNVVDILDESDEQLRHKYQLIYPIGTQLQVDGGKQRWTTPQEIMLLLQKNVRKISLDLGPHNLEFLHTYKNAEWPKIRLLSEMPGGPSKFLAEDIVYGKVKAMDYFRTLNSKQREKVLKYITIGDMKPKERIEVEHIMEQRKDELLILRGLFTYDLFTHILMKRWNVDFGVREGGQGRATKVAVPYRAKDTPSERSEFGHPDVAIGTTLISYYNQGLKYEEFVETMKSLNAYPTKDVEYSLWVNMQGDIPHEYSDHSCVNLADCVLMRLLHGLFAKNMRTVNYFLSNLVFPNETKQFEEKLCASSWHIAETKKYPTCGFSGTRDSAVLLPLDIQQKDLLSLKYTDCEVMKFLMDQQGSCVHSPPDSQIQGKELLLFLVQCNHSPRVLIDSGALLVSLTNKEVAEIWLDHSDPSISGAIFFDKNNRLTAIDRSKRCMDFALSPFSKRLDSVVVYLDDHHTRGTDLKLPTTMTAVVTLSVKLPKEKLVQACMRMRQLGKGQTVCFVPSPEVYMALQRDANGRTDISVYDVLLWATKNTVTMLETSMQQWATQGFVYARTKLAVRSKDNLRLFSRLIALPEHATLEQLYDMLRKESTGTAVIHKLQEHHDEKVRNALKEMNSDMDIYRSEYIPTVNKINARVAEYLSDFTTASNAFDEEQERELEQEVEEERESERPPPHEPASHSVSNALSECLKKRAAPLQLIDFPLRDAFQNTSLFNLVLKDPDAFDERIRVTKDFIHTVKQEDKENLDMFLRRPNCAIVFWGPESQQDLKLKKQPHNQINPAKLRVFWLFILRVFLLSYLFRIFRTIKRNNNQNVGHCVKQVVLVSQHEAEALLPQIRRSEVVSLHYVNVRTSASTELMLSPLHIPKRSQEDLINLRPVAIQISLFAGSKCFTGYAPFVNLLEDLYSFLGICPYPAQGAKEVQDAWVRLRDENIIDSNGWIKSAEKPASLHPDLAPFFEKCAHRFSNASPLEFVEKNAQKRYSEFSLTELNHNTE